jgi:iron(III) transport system substrate-binding protein
MPIARLARRAAGSLLFIALVLVGGAVSPASAQAQKAPGATAEEKEAAKREGQVTYYTARTTTTANTIARKASEALGIKVSIVRLASTLIFNRAVQEFDAGINAADVIDTSVTDHAFSMKKKGMLQPFTPASIAKFAKPAYYDAEHYWHASQIGLGAINYNSKLVKDPPKSWKELTDPKYKDKLVQGHVKASGTSLLLDYWLVKLYGWDYFKGLQRNNIMTHQSCDQTNIVASGERVVLMCDHQITVPALARNLPIETVFPEDGVIAQIGGMGILKKAPHPNAAKVLVDYLLSAEGQQVYVDGGLLSAINDPKITYPSKYPHPSKLKILVADPADVGRMLPELREKFSELFGG